MDVLRNFVNGKGKRDAWVAEARALKLEDSAGLPATVQFVRSAYDELKQPGADAMAAQNALN